MCCLLIFLCIYMYLFLCPLPIYLHIHLTIFIYVFLYLFIARTSVAPESAFPSRDHCHATWEGGTSLFWVVYLLYSRRLCSALFVFFERNQSSSFIVYFTVYLFVSLFYLCGCLVVCFVLFVCLFVCLICMFVCAIFSPFLVVTLSLVDWALKIDYLYIYPIEPDLHICWVFVFCIILSFCI